MTPVISFSYYETIFLVRKEWRERRKRRREQSGVGWWVENANSLESGSGWRRPFSLHASRTKLCMLVCTYCARIYIYSHCVQTCTRSKHKQDMRIVVAMLLPHAIYYHQTVRKRVKKEKQDERCSFSLNPSIDGATVILILISFNFTYDEGESYTTDHCARALLPSFTALLSTLESCLKAPKEKKKRRR